MVPLSLLIAVIMSALSLTACVTRTLEVKAAFDPVEAAYIHEKGTGVIRGQAFLHKKDGSVVYGTGSNVFLIPATQYADERTAKAYGGEKVIDIYTAVSTKFAATDPHYKSFVRSTKADEEGNFEFSDVAPGEYYVNTIVVWKEGDKPQGGSLIDKVSLREKEQVEVVMNDQ